MTESALSSRIAHLLSEPPSSTIEREQQALNGLLREADGRVVLFGAGGLGNQALRCLRASGVEPLAFSDNNPDTWNTSVQGLRIVPPHDLASRFGASTLVLVTIWNPYHWYTETYRKLSGFGCTRVSPPSPLYWHFAESFLPFYAQDLPHKVSAQIEDVRRAAALWSDEHSQREYLQQIEWRFNGAWSFERPPSLESYFVPEVFRLSADEVFVDCGAYDGDTLRTFLKYCHDFKQFIAIEPDAKNFTKLETYVRELGVDIRTRIDIVRAAVGARRQMVSFDETGELSSRRSERGTREILSIPIDELPIAHQAVSLIKMDIEGAELDALRGAASVIQRDRPVLAVCVYHRQDDLWRIPLYMKELLPDCRLFLRCHEGDGWQTVAYAVPPERVPIQPLQ